MYMSHKVLVVYYSQTGQLREIIDSVMGSFSTSSEIRLSIEEIRPATPFPFPWTSDEFFQAMPESVMGIPCELQPLSLTGDENFDLIVIAWQPWYLSPSIPMHAFFQLEKAKKLLAGKPVVTIAGTRNMWIMAHEDIRGYLHQLQATWVGNIILYDKAPNLISVFTIIRWLFTGKKGRYMKIIPPAGISDTDIKHASCYGDIILDHLLHNSLDTLRPALVEAGAVEILPSLVMLEKRGKLFFRIWASFILKKGSYGSKMRLGRVRLFKYYLLTVLYLVSPFASLLYFLMKPFRRRVIKKQISLYQSR
jgi:hypothetical protein